MVRLVDKADYHTLDYLWSFISIENQLVRPVDKAEYHHHTLDYLWSFISLENSAGETG